MKGLTERQKEVLGFIKSYIGSHGYPPSIAEVGAGIGLTPKRAKDLIDALAKKGFLERSSLPRSIRLLSKPCEVQAIGKVMAVSGDTVTLDVPLGEWTVGQSVLLEPMGGIR